MPNNKPTVQRAADVKPERVTWLWSHRIPRNKLSLLVGDPGVGKSTVTQDLAARLSKGLGMPGDPPTSRRLRTRNTLLSAPEDSASDTIRPRLEAMGANLERIFILDSSTPLRLPRDIETLR